MLLIDDSNILSKKLSKFKKLGRKINFIPTMGNLHEGHLKLVREGKKKNSVTLVSIFVNPLQFNDLSDFEKYPRTLEQDKNLLIKEEIDLLFTPGANFLSNHKVSLKLGDLSKKLCGKFREGHFEGVSSVIIRFLNLINPDFIFLGEKDFQQTLIIRKIIKDLGYVVKVKVLPTVRDENNVAYSSRNKLLRNDFSLATLIPKTLNQIIREIKNGNFKLTRINEIKNSLKNNGIQKVEYLEILKEKDLNFPDDKFNICRIFISVNIDGVRLIDNLRLNKKIRFFEGRFLEVND